MKRMLLPILGALVLTLPVYVVIATNNWVRRWLDSDAGFAIFKPLFRLTGSLGGEEDYDVIIATLLVASFLIALGLVSVVIYLVRRLKPRAAG